MVACPHPLALINTLRNDYHSPQTAETGRSLPISPAVQGSSYHVWYAIHLFYIILVPNGCSSLKSIAFSSHNCSI